MFGEKDVKIDDDDKKGTEQNGMCVCGGGPRKRPDVGTAEESTMVPSATSWQP